MVKLLVLSRRVRADDYVIYCQEGEREGGWALVTLEYRGPKMLEC